MSQPRYLDALNKADTTQSLVIESGALDKVDQIFSDAFGDSPGVIIADENTFEAAGKVVQEKLKDAGRKMYEPMLFPGTPRQHADLEKVLQVEAYINSLDANPIAVGSGTMNDITKYATTRLKIPYMVVATAASMDGYTSFGASILHSGFKKNVPCTAPRAVLADLDVLTAAPPEMAVWGFGDILGKYIAGADWILADALGIEPILQTPWDLVMGQLQDWLQNPGGIIKGDPQVFSNLLEGLVVTGLAMQIGQSSRVASGSEHLFGHHWEMAELKTLDGEEVSHGMYVGIGTVVAAALYDVLLKIDFGQLDVDQAVEAWPAFADIENQIQDIFDQPYLVEFALEESRAKYVSRSELKDRLRLLRTKWPEIKFRIKQLLPTAAELQAELKKAGALVSPAQIGVDGAELRKTYWQASRIRNRYTVLDLAVETNTLDQCLDQMFSSGGIWEDL